jgi:hypothetical protein
MFIIICVSIIGTLLRYLVMSDDASLRLSCKLARYFWGSEDEYENRSYEHFWGKTPFGIISILTKTLLLGLMSSYIQIQ